MPEAQLKGSAYLSTLAYIETHFGGIAKHKVLSRLTPEDRSLYGGVMLPIRWYPLDPFPRLLRAMEQELGRGDLKIVVERGTWTAIHDMKTVHRVLLKLMTPSWVIEKAAKLWPNFHTTGRWEVKRTGEQSANAILHDLGVVDEAMCATLKGWILGLMTLAGTQNPTVNHDECRARGARSCVYATTWR